MRDREGGRRHEVGLFLGQELARKELALWLATFSDLSSFAPISGSGFLLKRPIRTHATKVYVDVR